MKPRIYRFTLIELLVVIAVILILMAVLLPALTKAKDRAKLLLCKTNQKQHYLGIYNYSVDFNDHMPAPMNGHYAMKLRLSDLPLNYASLYHLNYLNGNTEVLFCPDNSYSEEYQPGSNAYLQNVIKDGFNATGAGSTTYILRGPAWNAAPFATKLELVSGNPGDGNVSFWEWDPVIQWKYATIFGTASLLRNNLAGSGFSPSWHPKLQSPRALGMDLLPERYWYNNSVWPAPKLHRQRAFNVLFADGTVFTNHCQDPIFMTPGNDKWLGKFVSADRTHPSHPDCY